MGFSLGCLVSHLEGVPKSVKIPSGGSARSNTKAVMLID